MTETKYEVLTTENIYDLIDSVATYKEMASFLNDDKFDRALALVIKCMNKPDVPQERLKPLLTELESLGANAHMHSKFYRTLGKKEPGARDRSEIYLSLYKSLERLVDALKYQAR